MKKLVILSSLLIALSACSQQWREVKTDVTSEDALAASERIISGAQASGERFDSSLLNDILQDPTGSIYYAETGLMGKVGTLFSFHNLEWLMYDRGSDIFTAGIENAAVLFVDGLAQNDQRYFALLVETVAADGFTDYFVAISEPNAFTFSDEEFAVELTGRDGRSLILRSFDVSDSINDELASNIKLSVSQLDAFGREVLVGQFSVLAGFGG